MFTNNWFARSQSCFDLLNSTESYSFKPISLLEIGVWEGQSTTWFLDNILTHDESRMISIDMKPQELFYRNLSLSSGCDKHRLIIDRSQLALPTLHGELFDIVYVDGSHFPDDVLRDAVMSFELLRVGGYIVFDDYQNNTDSMTYLVNSSQDRYNRDYNARLNMNRCGIDNKRGSYGSLGVIQCSDAISFFVHAYAPFLECIYRSSNGVLAYRKLGRSYDEYIRPTYK
jgi:predicted O-methyltransferase YrrM